MKVIKRDYPIKSKNGIVRDDMRNIISICLSSFRTFKKSQYGLLNYV